MALDANAFIEKYKDNLTPEEIADIKEQAAGYMRTSDYHSKMDIGKRELAVEAQRVKDHEAALRQWEADNMFGPTATNPAPQPPAGTYISKADFDAALKQQEERILGQVAPAVGGIYALSTMMPKFYADYARDYSKPFPAQKFIDFCNENKIADPDLGYKLFTTEDEKARLTTQHAADIVKAGEDAVRAFRTQNHLPETPLNRVPVPSPLMRTPRPQVTPPVVTPPVQQQQVPPTVAAMQQAAPDLADRMQQNFMQALEK